MIGGPLPRRTWGPVASVTVGVGLQRGLGALLPMLLAVVATRSGGFEAAGVVGVSSAAALLIAAAADLGISQAAVRDFATAPPGRRDLFALLFTKLAAGSIAAIALAAVSLALSPGTWGLALAAAALAIPAASATTLLTSKHTVDGDGLILGLGAGFGFAAGAIAAVTIVAVSGEPAPLLLSLAIGRGVEAVLLFAGLRVPRFASRGIYGPRWVLRAWPLSAVGLLQIAYLRGQVLIPGAILTSAAAGQVVDGFNLYSAATLLPGALGLAAFPSLARAASSSYEDAVRAAARFGLLNLLLVAGPVAALLLVPGLLAETVFGESSASLEAYVRWGALATLFIAPNAVLLMLALALRRERLAAIAWVAGLGLSAALTAVLTREYGVAGAGAAVAASEVVLTVLLSICALPAAGRLQARAFFRREVLAVAVAAAAGVLIGLLSPIAAFAGPDTGFLPLAVLPVLLVLALWAAGYSFFAPGPVFAISWLSALAVAQFPLYPTFGWNAEAWLLLTLPPAALAAGAFVAAGRDGFTGTRPLPARLMLPPIGAPLVLAAALAGAAGWFLYFAQIGTVPLFSDQIDIARFRPFGLPTLVGTRLGYVAVIAAIPGFALARDWPERRLFAIALAVALVPMVLSGGRLYPFSAVAIGVFATILVRGLTVRTALAGLAGAVVLVGAASAIFFVRIEQQADGDNDFKQHLEQELRPGRPEILQWTIPVQMAAAASMYTLADLAATHAHEMDDAPGLYSTKFLDRFIPSGDLEQVTRTTARFGLITTTYVGPWYADFGLVTTVALSLTWGLAAGLLWRWWARRPSPLSLLFSAYSAFWLMYAIYLNYWAVHGVWLADVAFMALLVVPGRSVFRWLLALAARYEAAGQQPSAVSEPPAADRPPRHAMHVAAPAPPPPRQAGDGSG